MSRKYQVQTGDVLTKIAQRYYGDANLFGRVQRFYNGDMTDGAGRWFAFHTATRLYVVGPVDHLTFSAGFAGPGSSQDGFAEVHVCVNGYLEAAPAA